LVVALHKYLTAARLLVLLPVVFLITLAVNWAREMSVLIRPARPNPLANPSFPAEFCIQHIVLDLLEGWLDLLIPKTTLPHCAISP
jgi:hypothetical protein